MNGNHNPFAVEGITWHQWEVFPAVGPDRIVGRMSYTELVICGHMPDDSPLARAFKTVLEESSRLRVQFGSLHPDESGSRCIMPEGECALVIKAKTYSEITLTLHQLFELTRRIDMSLELASAPV